MIAGSNPNGGVTSASKSKYYTDYVYGAWDGCLLLGLDISGAALLLDFEPGRELSRGGGRDLVASGLGVLRKFVAGGVINP